MARSGQIIPKYSFPHTETYINDYTERVTPTVSGSSSNNVYALCVFPSPMGEDGKMKTIAGGIEEFLNTYGKGSGDVYGQSYMNAYAAAQGGAVLQCLRITPTDAEYSNVQIWACYKVVAASTDPEHLDVKFGWSSITGDTAKTLEDLSDFTKFVDVPGDDQFTIYELESGVTTAKHAVPEGYTAVCIASIAMTGKGTYGKDYAIQIQNVVTEDKRNDYKNKTINVVDLTTFAILESFPVSFYPYAVTTSASLFADDVVNDVNTGSQYIRWYTNVGVDATNSPVGIDKIFDEWNTINQKADTVDTTTIETFDIFQGIKKSQKDTPLPYYTITGQNDVTSATGLALDKGNDGTLSTVLATDEGVLTEAGKLFENAFTGKIDKAIKSKSRFPLTYIMDANYPKIIKKYLYSLANSRTDCVVYFDATTETGKSSATWADIDGALADLGFDDYTDIENYVLPLAGKVKDPVSLKPIAVTYTYLLSRQLPLHFAKYGGKHVPFAGSNYGIISGFITNTAYPIYDEDIDFVDLDEYADNHVNYAKYNSTGSICIAMQDTHQQIESDLSEMNAVLIMKDIKRDCEKLIDEIEFQFSEDSDISRFNTMLEMRVLPSYSSAQVKSITGSFSQTTYENERNILHLKISIDNKSLVKIGIIEIDII